MSPAPVTALLFGLALGANAPAPERPPKKPRAREAVVLAAAPQEPGEPAFLLACLGPDGALRDGAGCKAPALGTRARRLKAQEHAVGRPLLAAPCELTKSKRPAVQLEPPPPRGPFLAVWPAQEAGLLTAADDLPTRVPDPPALRALEAAVGGTPIFEQSLVVDLERDGQEERLFSVRSKDGPARLVVLASGDAGAWRALPAPEGARALRVLAAGDLDRDRHLELFVFAQLEAGWELWVLEAGAAAPAAALACAAGEPPATPPLRSP